MRAIVLFLLPWIAISPRTASATDRTAIEAALRGAIKDDQPVLNDRGFADCRDRMFVGTPKIKDIRDADATTSVVIGELSEPDRKAGASFVGVYAAEPKKFQYLAISESANITVQVEKLAPSEGPFVFVAPVYCKDASQKQELLVFRRDAGSGTYQKVVAIRLRDNVLADGASGTEHYVDTSRYTLTAGADPDQREITVETTRQQIEGKRNFASRREVYRWTQGQFVVVERVEDGKRRFGRNDPMAEIARWTRADGEESWTRLLDLVEHANPEVAHAAWSALALTKMQKRRDEKAKLSEKVVDYVVAKYVAATKESRARFQSILTYKAFNYGDPALTADQARKLEGTLANDADLKVHTLLAAAGDANVWAPLVKALRDGLAGGACKAVDACRGLRHFAGTRTPSTEEAQLFRAAGNAKGACENLFVNEICSEVLTPYPKPGESSRRRRPKSRP